MRMKSGSTDVIQQMGRLFGAGPVTGLTDRQLLDRFHAHRDESAFEALIARHGPMVLGVCRDVLRDATAAEDAFQAAFLVLLRRSHAIRGRDGLGGWLHRVTFRIALRARREAMRRTTERLPGEAAAPDDPPADAAARELRCLLRRELDRMPEAYRAPIVLCDLEGLTHDEAALRLAWPVGTVKGRLVRGREKLRDRLVRRGVTAPVALLVVTLTGDAVRAAVPDILIRKTVFAAFATKASGAVPGPVAGLVSGALRAMFWTSVGKTGAVLLTAGLVTGVVAGAVRDDDPASPPAASGGDAAPVPAGLDALQGAWELVGSESNGKFQATVKTGDSMPALLIVGDRWYSANLVDGARLDQVEGAVRLRVVTAGDPASPLLEVRSENEADAQVVKMRFDVNGEALILCGRGNGGEPVPASVRTRPGDGATASHWKRIPLEGETRATIEAIRKDPLSVPKARPSWYPRVLNRAAKDAPPRPLESAELAGERAAIELRELELEAQKRELTQMLDERATQAEALRLARDVPQDQGTLLRMEGILKSLERGISEREVEYVKRAQELARRKGEVARGEALLAPPSIPEPGDGRRVLAPGDFLLVEFLEALPGRPITGERIVRPDGTISLGFYGDVFVAGLDRREIKEKLIRHMQKFLTDECLGLVDQDPETGKPRPIPPADSDRVIVDDSANYIEPARQGRVRGSFPGTERSRLAEIDTKLDAILERLNRIEATRSPR